MKTDELRNIICSMPFAVTAYYDEEPRNFEKNACVFVHTLEQGGSQKAAGALIERLTGHGYGVFVISPVDGKYAGIYAENAGVCVVVIDDSVDLIGTARDNLLLFDMVFINSFCSFRYSLYYVNTDIPCIYWIHEGVEITKDNIKNIDHILVGSKNLTYAFPWLKPLRMWEEAFPHVKTAFLPIEVEDVFEEKTDKASDRVRFLIPGSYYPHKGFHVALQAIVMMEAKGFRNYEAVFCGYGYGGEYYETISRACSKYDNIRLLGELGKEELYDRISQADCVIVPSLFDAGPLTAVEALMYGKAVIVSDSCGISGFIEDCNNGFVFSNEDYEELFKRMLIVYHDKTALGELCRRGRDVYKRNFSKEVMDDAFEGLIKDCSK